MAPNLKIISVPRIKVNGQDASPEIHQSIISIDVDDTVLLPSMFTIRLYDRELKWINSNSDLEIGQKIEIGMRAEDQNQAKTILTGEITAIEPEFDQFDGPSVLIHGYDKSFRLHRGKKTRIFNQVKDSDIASKIAGDCQLTIKADATSGVYDYVCQDNKSDMEFLRERAALNGYFVYCEQGKLCFVKTPPSATPVTMEWGGDLLDFKARLTAVEQVDSVRVRAWDRIEKKEIVGQVTAPDDKPSFGESKTGGVIAQSAFGKSEEVVNDCIVETATAAKALAQAVCNEINNSFVQAEGTCLGNPDLHAGMTVELKKLGTRFSGKYRVTRVVHNWGTSEYLTSFEISGRRTNTLGEIFAPKSTSRYGTVVGIVIDNKDPDDLGRVKVKFPTIVTDDNGQAAVSTWARLVSPMAGAERGIEFIPEIDDEVLVAFEYDDVNRPYVLGSLWNKTDKPPLPNSGAVGSDGKVNQRIIQSRAKHKIVLDDTQDNEKISVIDKTGKNLLEIDSKNNLFSIKADKKIAVQTASGYKIVIDNDGKKIEVACGQSTVNIEDSNGIEIKNGMSSIKCTSQGIEIKCGPATLKCTASSVEVTNGVAKISLSGPTVNINNGALEVT